MECTDECFQTTRKSDCLLMRLLLAIALMQGLLPLSSTAASGSLSSFLMTPISVTTGAGAPSHSTKPLIMSTPELGSTPSPPLTADMAKSHKRSASAPALVPDVNNSDNKDPATTASAFLRHATTRVVEYLHPAPLRQEYHDIANALAGGRYAYHFIFLSLLFGLAEYEQPGWFPRPEELSAAVVRLPPRYS